MRRQLPSATVTFLFTDVEGSTRLLQELGAKAYAEALAEHRRVLRKAFAAETGAEVLLVGAGLLIRSFKVLREVNPGFESSGVLTQTVAVSRAKFSNIQQEVAFFDRVLENVRGRNVYLVQSTVFPTNANFMELLFWIDAFSRASASLVQAAYSGLSIRLCTRPGRASGRSPA